jgi:hypothetical protein
VQVHMHFPVVGRMVDSWRALVERTPLSALVPREKTSPSPSPSPCGMNSARFLQTREYTLGGGNSTRASAPRNASSLHRAGQGPRSSDSNSTSMSPLDVLLSVHSSRSEVEWSHQSPESLTASLLAWPNTRTGGFS